LAHNRRWGLARLLRITTLALAAAVMSCTPFPEPDADDEGHATFAREAIKVLLGRPARGVDEVEVVADIAQFLGRDVAARMLMEDPEFTDHWSEVMIDVMEVRREVADGLGAQDQTCWGDPTLPTADPAIAEWVQAHGPLAGGAGKPDGWNMTDLVRSAIAKDHLAVLYRVNLFPLSTRLNGGDNRRQALATHFKRTYLHRDVACLRCHNPTYSASNLTDDMGDIVWRRMWTIPGHPEKALFGNYYDAAAVMARLQPIFRGDVRRPVANGPGIRPWGMAESCVTDRSGGSVSHNGFQTLGAGAQPFVNAGFGSLDGASNPRLSIWELEDALNQGVTSLEDGYERLAATAPVLPADQQSYCDVLQIFSANCTGCHSNPPSGGLNLAGDDPAGELINVPTASGGSTHPTRVVPGDTAMSELWRRVETGSMPPGPGNLNGTDLATINAWIAGNAPATPSAADCNTSPIPEVDPDEGFAFLVASSIVDRVWKHVMGGRLTIDHGYPRNKEQMYMLRRLTEYTFIKEDWSLKAVLAKIIASDWFARRAPAISQADTGYELPPLPDPWIEANPVDVPNPSPHQEHNGQGELVNRARVNTLIRQISASLGWREAELFPGSAYPRGLAETMGQFYSPLTPGFEGINFQSLLALEDEIALCSPSGHAAGAEDFIDLLAAGVVAFNAANPQAPLTLGETWAVLKDRMIQDPTIERGRPSGIAEDDTPNTEEAALVAFLNAELAPTEPVTLHSSTAGVSEAELETVLRRGCAVIMKSPQFLLTHLTPRGYDDNQMPDPPRLAVCMPGEACGYGAICNRWRSRLSGMGHTIACEDRTVREGVWFIFPGYIGTLELSKAIEVGPLVPVGSLSARSTIEKVDLERLTMEHRAVTLPGRGDPRPIDPSPLDPTIGPDVRPLDDSMLIIRPRIAGGGEGIVIAEDLDSTLLRREELRDALVVENGALMLDLNRLAKAIDPKRRRPDGVETVVTKPLRHERPVDLSSRTRFDALRSVAVVRDGAEYTPMDRVRQRVETLCLPGLCGFERRSARHVNRCLADPRGGACATMQPTCDPRTLGGETSCAPRPTDYTDTGMLVIWAEGAEVKLAEGARILRGTDARKWAPLRGRERLRVGDLIHLPIKGRIEIERDGVLFGDSHAEIAAKTPVSGHVIAVVGEESADALLVARRDGALSPAAVELGVESERFQSAPLVAGQLRRSIGYGAKPLSRLDLTLKEIAEINADFDRLHEGMSDEELEGILRPEGKAAD